MGIPSYLAFCGLCLLLALTPGPDTFLILRFSMRRAAIGVAAAFGSAFGSLLWAVLVGIGLAALIEQSVETYRVVKILGGLYLVYLGIQALRHSRVAAVPEPGIPALVYLACLAKVAAKANKWLKRPRVTVGLERTSGGILAALGVGVLASTAVE